MSSIWVMDADEIKHQKRFKISLLKLDSVILNNLKGRLPGK